jgi:hypothetical protein
MHHLRGQALSEALEPQPPRRADGTNDRPRPGRSVLEAPAVVRDPGGTGSPLAKGAQDGHFDPSDRAARDRIAGRRADHHDAGLGHRLALAHAPSPPIGDDLTGRGELSVAEGPATGGRRSGESGPAQRARAARLGRHPAGLSSRSGRRRPVVRRWSCRRCQSASFLVEKRSGHLGHCVVVIASHLPVSLPLLQLSRMRPHAGRVDGPAVAGNGQGCPRAADRTMARLPFREAGRSSSLRPPPARPASGWSSGRPADSTYGWSQLVVLPHH